MCKKKQKLQITLHQRNSNSCKIETCLFLRDKLAKVRKMLTLPQQWVFSNSWKIKLKSSLAACDKGIKIPTSFYLVFPFMGLYPWVVTMELINVLYKRLFVAVFYKTPKQWKGSKRPALGEWLYTVNMMQIMKSHSFIKNSTEDFLCV